MKGLIVVAAALVALMSPQAFTSAYNYMSDCGYMRWQIFQIIDRWEPPMHLTQMIRKNGYTEAACNF